MKKKFRMTNGALIAIIVVISLIWGTMPYPAFSQTRPQNQTQNANIPGEKKLVDPEVIIANFETGTNQLTQLQQNELHNLYNQLQNDPKLVAILMGTVSDLRINGGCYLESNNPSYFSTPGNRDRFPNANATYRKGANANETNEICQSGLALSRAFAVRNWLVENGVKEDRIYILNYATQGLIPGSNFPNQSVLAWIIGSGKIDCPPCPPDKPCPPCAETCTPEIVGLPDCCTMTIGQVEKIDKAFVVKVEVDCSNCPKNDKPDCQWYWLWPCMSNCEKIFWGSVITGGIVALILASVKAEAETSNTHACSGSGC